MMSETKEAPPTITFTTAAKDKLESVLAVNGDGVSGLRLEIYGRQEGEFQHVLSLVQSGKEPAGDIETDVDGMHLYIESKNARYLDGVEVDFEEKASGESGLLFANPNPLWFDEPEATVQRIFDEQINPQIAAHGGYVTLLAVDGSTAFVRLGGACQGCGLVDVTLKQGIEASLREMVPEIEHVVDETDHASGENPYHKPSKK
jgi:Fe/S biogenesis protein NfuA